MLLGHRYLYSFQEDRANRSFKYNRFLKNTKNSIKTKNCILALKIVDWYRKNIILYHFTIVLVIIEKIFLMYYK